MKATALLACILQKRLPRNSGRHHVHAHPSDSSYSMLLVWHFVCSLMYLRMDHELAAAVFLGNWLWVKKSFFPPLQGRNKAVIYICLHKQTNTGELYNYFTTCDASFLTFTNGLWWAEKLPSIRSFALV